MLSNSIRALRKRVEVFGIVYVGTYLREYLDLHQTSKAGSFWKNYRLVKAVNYLCKKYPSWMFGKVLKTSMKFL